MNNKKTLNFYKVSSEDYLTQQIRDLPNEALERLQYLQPQVGCFNSCSFCSQEAGRDVWQFTKAGLTALFNAISIVIKEKSITIGSGRNNHRPNVIFPYMDNDISTYPYIYDYFSLASNALNVKIRISTLGFSASSMQNIPHERLVEDFKDYLDGIRFSFTPYAAAYQTNKQRYIQDVGNSMKIYKPLIDHIGVGASTAAVELRFSPMLFSSPKQIFDRVIDGYHVISTGQYMLISKDQHTPLQIASIKEINGRHPELTVPARRYKKITSNVIEYDPEKYASEFISNNNDIYNFNGLIVENADLYLWQNADGPYYAINPFPDQNGKRNSLQIYPKTDIRPKSGYINGCRPFLDALIDYKQKFGLKRKDTFLSATWDDVENVITLMKQKASSCVSFDKRMTDYINFSVVPLVEDYINTMKFADFEPNLFFDPNWTIDTGPIVNQGRAKSIFKGLTNNEDEPMSINEERGYGAISLSSERGTVWRIAPIPSSTSIATNISSTVVGKKNMVTNGNRLIVEELDPQHLRPFSKETGLPLRRFVIEGVEIEHHSRYSSNTMNNYPGAKNEPEV